MAQPIFEHESPLDSYLADTEIDLMPGTLAEFSQPDETANDSQVPDWVPSFILTFCQSLESLMYQPANTTPSREFAERFKYIIISSPLLSTYLSPAPTEIHTIPEPETPTASDSNVAPSTTISTLLVFLMVPIFFASGNFATAIIAFALARILGYYAPAGGEARLMQSKLALQSLQGLIEADAAWESAVGEAMDLLRRDESSNASIQWQTPLRIALQSSLQAITTQVDRVRQLFTPLTAPVELAQMTEMYAPPSPINPYQSLSQQQQQGSPTRSRQSISASKLDKRITWSGTTSKQLFRRSLIGDGGISPRGEAVPPVPRLPSPDELASFGALALDLQRNKTTPSTPVRHSMMMPRSAGSLRVSPNSTSRFTTMQNLRNPLSMSSLDSALQSALGSKRFACAHLLALRFDGDDGESTVETDGEGEDELYWENVRSVIGLLASSLEDETSRLGEALEEWHASRQRDARPSVTSTPSPSPSPAQTSTPIPPSGLLSALDTTPRRRRAEIISFAPQTSDMGKMTGHVQSIAGNLDHAFDELESCVAELKKFDSTSNEEEGDEVKNTLETSAKSAMDAYEALRRELGMALRECERARGPLLSILRKQSISSENEEQQQPEEVSPLTRQGEDDSFPLDSPTRAGASSPPPAYVSRGPSQIVDDATAHLLAETTAGHLPPPGVDRVYEAETGPASNVGAFRKERSALSRADRIKLAQAKRRNVKSQGNVLIDEDGNPNRPIVLTGEVVEELKEVIKTVNERKQRMAMLPPRQSILESASPRSSVKQLASSEEVYRTNLTKLSTSRV